MVSITAYARPQSQPARSLRALSRQHWEQGWRRPLVPLMGYPGLNLTRTTVKQNQFNHVAQYQSLLRLYERFHPDAALFLMDLSVEASALGLPVRFPLEETPTVEGHPVDSREELERYRRIDLLADGRVMVYLQVMRHLRAALPVPVGGYVTGPFTLAGLLMGANRLALNVLLEPDLTREVLEFCFGAVRTYAEALVEAGAEFLMVLDPTAVMLGPGQFAQFAGVYVRELVGLLHDTEILLHICGNTMPLLEVIADTGAAGLSLDSCVDLAAAARVLGPDMLLIGNVDPVGMLRHNPIQVYAETAALLHSLRDHPQFVLSTGCDLPQHTPAASIQALVDAGRQWIHRAAAAPGAPAGGCVCATGGS